MYVFSYSYNHATPSAAHAGGGIYNCDDYMFIIVIPMSIFLCGQGGGWAAIGTGRWEDVDTHTWYMAV